MAKDSVRVPLVRRWYDEISVPIDLSGNSLTQQNFKDECDINNIMARFQKTGVLDHVNKHQGDYGDYTDLPVDFADAQNLVLRAQAMFMELPARVRERFGNDAGEFLSAVEDPDRRGELEELGLLEGKEPEPAEPAPKAARAAAAPKEPAEAPETSAEGS